MKSLPLFALLATLCCVPPAWSQGSSQGSPESIEVSWKKKTYSSSELPEELGEGPKLAVAAWSEWCSAHEYQMNLVPDGRVLLVTRQGSGKLGRQLRLLSRTQKEFDRLLPAPERAQPPAKESPQDTDQPATDEVPEDPEGGTVGWRPQNEEPQEYTWEFEWGSGTWPVDSETCVMFVVHDEEDYGSLVDRLAEMEEYLKPWAKSGKRLTGFVHEKPLVAAYIANASGQEEWDPENELVHRVAQMLFVRRFASIQPYWVTQGFSWYIEDKIRGSIYCFPYRHEFVYATEHTGWDNELRNMFVGREREPLTTAEFSNWKRGRYDGDSAKLSYGLVGYIARYHASAFSPLLESMRLFALEDSKRDDGNGNWSRDETYAISKADQERYLKEFLGPACLEEAAEFFRKGKKFKPRKK